MDDLAVAIATGGVDFFESIEQVGAEEEQIYGQRSKTDGSDGEDDIEPDEFAGHVVFFGVALFVEMRNFLDLSLCVSFL